MLSKVPNPVFTLPSFSPHNVEILFCYFNLLLGLKLLKGVFLTIQGLSVVHFHSLDLIC